MHYWRDEWFQKYGPELYGAIEVLENRIRKWAKCGVCGKEKYGTYRDEYFRMWDGGLYEIFFGYRAWPGDGFWQNLLWKIDNYLVPVKTRFGWSHKGLADFNRWIGLTKMVHKWQVRMVNKAFQVTCKEHPDIIDELVSDTDCYEMIKPCKWGNVDGQTIHDKYWKKLN